MLSPSFAMYFASAHPARIASIDFSLNVGNGNFASAHPARIASRLTSAFVAAESLCLSTPRTDCIAGGISRLRIRRDFASAHPVRIASFSALARFRALSFASAHPVRIASYGIARQFQSLFLCLSTPHTDCISKIAQMQCHKSTQYAVSW